MSRADQVSFPASSLPLFGLEVRPGLINGLQEARSAGVGQERGPGSRKRKEAGKGRKRALCEDSCSGSRIHFRGAHST